MTQSPAIDVRNVSKSFRLTGGTTARSLKATVLGMLRGRRSVRILKALHDVSFTVSHGETLGIIGANGAGKSTLLALLTGTMQPSQGSIRTHGTISALLELGAGFHPELTGRDKVFLYGAIMGLTRRQMQERFDAIVDFAGIGDFIDQPIKHYSSGMYVRLGFAVAVEVDPDILLIDEVLAVGDANFQRRCLDKMQSFRASGKTMLIISHDLHTIQKISDRILVLDEGRIAGLGDPENMVDAYESMNRKKETDGLRREWGTGEVRLTGVRLTEEEGAERDVFQWGGALYAEVSYEAVRRIEQPVFGFAVSDKSGRLIYGNNTQIEGVDIPAIEGKGSVHLRMKPIQLCAGEYVLSFSIHSSDHKVNYHRLDHAFPFAVESDHSFEGVCHMPVEWTV